LYSRSEKLDNHFAKVAVVEAQVLLLNILDDQLVVFCADNVISIYNLCVVDPSVGPPTSLHLTKVRSYDASFIPGLNFHPACVVLVGLSTLKIGTHRGTAAGPSSGGTSGIPSRDTSTLRETSPALQNPADLPSLILNICGRVVMIQQQQPQNEMCRDGSGLPGGRDSPSQMALPTVLASGCETIWFPRAAGHTDKPHLTASLWLYCGAHGMRVWLPVFPREGDHGHTFMSKRIMLHFPLEDFYPLAILFEDAIILGAENDTVLYNASNLTTTRLPYSTLQRTSLLFLHPILRQLIRRNLGYHAWEIARTCMTLPYFQHSLELLLHEVLEEEATSTEPIPDALLPSVVDFIQEFPVFHKTIGRCARKTEVALWHHLFSVVGSPRALFLECLHIGDLETAASYLLILQNLEPPAVAQNHATLLLDAALDKSDWDLARELVRFLRTIDPDEMTGGSQDGGQMVTSAALRGMTSCPQSPPISAISAEEEISHLLGTLQVPRGRTASITHAAVKAAATSTKDGLQRSNSESKARATAATTSDDRVRKTSSSGSAGDDGVSPDDFYIDVILQRHARKLLGGCRLKDLGTFAAQLDFQMVSWLKREAGRAARVDNFVSALQRVHSDFAWPLPVLLTAAASMGPSQIFQGTRTSSRKYSNSSEVSSTVVGSSVAAGNTPAVYTINSPQLPGVGGGASSLRKHGQARISDSGYLSHIAGSSDVPTTTSTVTSTSKTSKASDGSSGGKESAATAQGADPHQLSEQTIHAMLRPLSFREDLSVLSEDMSSLIGSPIEATESASGTQLRLSPTSDWSSSQQQTPTNEGGEAIFAAPADSPLVISKGPQKSEVQLRYLLQLMMEANCLEIASLISVILKDALALIRIVNAVRSPPEDKTAVSRIYQNLKALEAWAQSECHGYTPFFQAIQPQLNSLRTFLLNQSTKTVIGSTSSVSSSSNAVTSPVSAGRQLLSSVTSPLMVTPPKDVSLAQQPSGGLFTRRAMGGPGLAMASAPGTARTSPLQEQPGAQGQKISSQSFHGTKPSGETLASTTIAGSTSGGSGLGPKNSPPATAVRKSNSVPERASGGNSEQSVEFEDHDASNCLIM